jgi:hypothetical protein
MPSNGSELWARAEHARDKLAGQFLGHPEVSLVDIVYEPGSEAQPAHLALRVHLRESGARQALVIPEEIDGIPIRVAFGDYRPE